MPVDFLGQELNVGDNVVFLNHCRTSSNLGRGKITSMAEHTVTIDLATRRAEYKVVKIPCIKHGHWEFNFIGANIDTKLEASKIGIDGLSAMSYTASDIGTKAVYTSLSNSISSLRSTGEYDKVTLSTDISDSLNVNETIIKSL